VSRCERSNAALTVERDGGQATCTVPVQRWVALSDVAHVSGLRRGVVAFARGHGMAAELLPDLAIAVSEMLTNVALHSGRADPLTIEVEVEDDVVVVIRGAGVGLSPEVNGPAARTGMIVVRAWRAASG
jgi:hypothetical protein